MKYNLRKNWIASLEIIREKPAIMLPFVYIAFIEALALEFIYFSAMKPLALVAGPVINKFFGKDFLHYPGNIILLPRLFYYAQLVIYVSAGVLLIAVSVNIFKNIRMKLPVRLPAMFKNALRAYPALFGFGILFILAIVFTKRLDIFIFGKAAKLAAGYAPNFTAKFSFLGLTLFLFLSNIIIQVFLMLTIPIIVIEKKPLIKALGRSVLMGLKNFFTLFTLLLLPFLIYLPILLLKSGAAQIAQNTFPEIVVIITAIGIIASIFIDCFIIICLSQFLLDKGKIVEELPII